MPISPCFGYTMCDAARDRSAMNLRDFAQMEYRGAPLNTMLHARFPKTLAVFLKSAAMVEGVTESTLIRYACEEWASTQGYSRSGI